MVGIRDALVGASLKILNNEWIMNCKFNEGQSGIINSAQRGYNVVVAGSLKVAPSRRNLIF